MTNKITKGEVAITLAGEELTLTPSLSAFSTLSVRYSNYGQLLNLIAEGNVPALVFTLRHALGWGDKQAKTLPTKVMMTGVHKVSEPLAEFVYRLFNAGKSMEEVMAEEVAAVEDKAPGKPVKKDKAAEVAETDPLLNG